MTMVACLCEHEDQIAAFNKITKLSNDERVLGEFILQQRRAALENLKNNNWWIDQMIELEVRPGHGNQPERARQRLVQLARSVLAEEELIEMIEKYTTPQFPISGDNNYIIISNMLIFSGRDLIEVRVKKGPQVRSVLTYLFDLWMKSRFTESKESLLERANDSEIPDLTKRRKSRSPKRWIQYLLT